MGPILGHDTTLDLFFKTESVIRKSYVNGLARYYLNDSREKHKIPLSDLKAESLRGWKEGNWHGRLFGKKLISRGEEDTKTTFRRFGVLLLPSNVLSRHPYMNAEKDYLG